jgi:hypothetical protein
MILCNRIWLEKSLKIRHLELGLQVTSEAFEESKNNSKFLKNFKQLSNCCVNAKKKAPWWSLFRVVNGLNSITKHFLFEFASLLRFQ